MTVVDVNTGKFTGQGGNLEETVTRNNLEAAEEIVRQLRLRDIGGIIVIDFIDMVLESNRDLVLRRLTECLGRDRTKHQVAEVTSLGLVQMTRKRIGQGLLEAFSTTCEACGGRGHLVSSEPVGGDEPAEERGRRGGNDRERDRRRASAAGARRATSRRGEPGREADRQDAAAAQVRRAWSPRARGRAPRAALHDEVHEADAPRAGAPRGRSRRGPRASTTSLSPTTVREHLEAVEQQDAPAQPVAGSGGAPDPGDETGSGDEWVEAGSPGDDQQPADGPGSWGPDAASEDHRPDALGDEQPGDAESVGDEHTDELHHTEAV